LPKAIIFAGANGAGKTTFARNVLPLLHAECTFLNADEIQREDVRFGSPTAAGRELLHRLTNLLGNQASFALETTLSSRMYARDIPNWRAAGYAVWLYYLEATSADFAVARVAQRVAFGGHGIPEADIRRRYARGLALFPTYQSLADVWYHFRVDEKGPLLVAKKAP
jgi:predicted ABC-type ATPase